jgi:putative hydrolase of the HAD superfamily
LISTAHSTRSLVGFSTNPCADDTFIADRLDLTLEAALTVQKTYFREHGTTLRGLMTVNGSAPMTFSPLYEVGLSCVPRDAVLVAAGGLPGHKSSIPTGRCAMPSGCSTISASPDHFAG